MSPSYLLDTNALSEPVKPDPDVRFLRRFRANKDRMAMASVTWHEALFGLFRLPEGHRRATIEEYLLAVIAPSVPVVPYDAAAAAWHAHERARLAKEGRVASFADGQIASVAKVHGLTLVTANVKDFSPFAGLTVESWVG